MQKGEPNKSKHSKAKNKNLENIIAIYFDICETWDLPIPF